MELTAKQQAVQAIQKAEHILLISPSHPDGDSVGACLAFYLAMQKMGKKLQSKYVTCRVVVAVYILHSSEEKQALGYKSLLIPMFAKLWILLSLGIFSILSWNCLRVKALMFTCVKTSGILKTR